jgi:uncharacterized membrane protein
MDELLGRRVHREYCWFTLFLLILLIACVDRVGTATLPSGSAAGEKLSSDTTQAGTDR